MRHGLNQFSVDGTVRFEIDTMQSHDDLLQANFMYGQTGRLISVALEMTIVRRSRSPLVKTDRLIFLRSAFQHDGKQNTHGYISEGTSMALRFADRLSRSGFGEKALIA